MNIFTKNLTSLFLTALAAGTLFSMEQKTVPFPVKTCLIENPFTTLPPEVQKSIFSLYIEAGLKGCGDNFFTTKTPYLELSKIDGLNFGSTKVFSGFSGDTVIINHDWTRVFTVSYGSPPRLWDIKTGQLIREFKAHVGGKIISVVFSPDETLFFTRHTELPGLSWDTEMGLFWNIEKSEPIHQFINTFSAEFSSDGTRILFQAAKGPTALWDAKKCELIEKFEGISSAQFSPDGARILSTRFDKGAIAALYDAKTGTLIKEFSLYSTMEFSPDGRHLLCKSNRATGRDYNEIASILNSETGLPLREFKGINSAILSCDGTQLMVKSKETTSLWNIKTGELIKDLGDSFLEELSPDGTRIICISKEKALTLWNAKTGQLINKFETDRGEILLVKFSPDGKRFLIIAKGKAPILLDAKTGQLIKEFKAPINDALRVEFSPDGKQLIVTHGIESSLWNVETGQHMNKFKFCNSIKFSPDNETIVFFLTSEVTLWDTKSGKECIKFGWKQNEIISDHSQGKAEFSPDGKTVFIQSSHSVLNLWSIASKEVVQSFQSSTPPVFSPDGKTLAIKGEKGITFYKSLDGIKDELFRKVMPLISKE